MVALVLGGTTPHIELIKELRELGFYIILVDYLDNPPAKQFADEHIQESTLDNEKVLQIAITRKADLVISACIDQANATCCYVAERLGLPHPYSYQTAIAVTDKSEMKKTMISGSIPTSWYYEASSVTEMQWEKIQYPAVVKPVDCNSSKGVHKVLTVDDAKFFFAEALEYSRTKKAIIEGFVEGTEIQVDCFASENDAIVVSTRQKKHIQDSNNDELNSEGSILPAIVCNGKEKEIKSIANKIANAFGLKNTPFFYQAIVEKTGEIKVLEFAPRVGGGLSYYILNNLVGFNAIRAVIDSYLGKKHIPHVLPMTSMYSTNLLYVYEGVFDHIEGVDECKRQGLIKDSFVMKEKGTYISSKLRSGNRVGAFVVEADSVEGLMQKENRIYELIDIKDQNGKSVLRKWRK